MINGANVATGSRTDSDIRAVDQRLAVGGPGLRAVDGAGQRAWLPSSRIPAPGSNRRSSCQVGQLSVDHTPVPSPARNAAPSPVVSSTRGRSTGTPSWSACSWQQQVVRGRAAVDAQRGSVAPASAVIASTTSRTSKAIASSVARARCARVVPRVMPSDGAARVGSQCGAPSPVSAGTNTTPPLSGTAAASASISAARSDDPQAVAQPLHRRAGHEDRALERVGHRPVRPIHADRREQPGSDGTGHVAGVDQHERAGAVRALRVADVEASPGRTARPAGRRRCRRSGRSSPRNAAGSVRPTSPYDGTTSGSAARGTPNSSHSSVPPARRREVEQQRAAGVGRVGDVARAAGQPGDDVGVDGADGDRAVRHAGPGVGVVLGQPGELGPGEVRVEPQPGQLGDPRLVAGALAARRRSRAVRRSCQTIARRGAASRSRGPRPPPSRAGS